MVAVPVPWLETVIARDRVRLLAPDSKATFPDPVLVSPRTTAELPLPKAPVVAQRKVPLLMVVVPVKVLLPCMVQVPEPDFKIDSEVAVPLAITPFILFCWAIPIPEPLLDPARVKTTLPDKPLTTVAVDAASAASPILRMPLEEEESLEKVNAVPCSEIGARTFCAADVVPVDEMVPPLLINREVDPTPLAAPMLNVFVALLKVIPARLRFVSTTGVRLVGLPVKVAVSAFVVLEVEPGTVPPTQLPELIQSLSVAPLQVPSAPKAGMIGGRQAIATARGAQRRKREVRAA